MANILAIDDNDVIREVLKFTLQNHHDVTLAYNGQEGISLARASQFDLIITDMKMPEMNGIEFIKEIRKNKSYASTPILVLTSNLDEPKDKAKATGATGWILKPFDPKKLLEVIDEALN